MAVNQTGAIFKSLIFDGENSRDYGVYITGEAVYNAPQRDVEMVTIAGRSGSLALDKGRFENIEVTYPAGIFAETEADFREAISDFRNLLCSKIGYVRLTDEYHPDEYRMAVYKSGLEVESTQLRAGQFNITFDCKPQRYLTDGETPITLGEWGETETVSGDIVEIENDGIEAVKSLSVSLEPIQSGSGTPSPDNVRPISGRTECDVYVSPTTSETDAEVYTTTLGRTVYGGTLEQVGGQLTDNMGYIASYNGETIGEPWISDRDEYVAGTTPSIGAEVVYTLATPQTYQLTGQDVELIEGTNYIWSDSGNVTIEHGQNPNYLVNPTRFESSPLLMVEGYGTIGFNGYEVELGDGVVGEVVIARSGTKAPDSATTPSPLYYNTGVVPKAQFAEEDTFEFPQAAFTLEHVIGYRGILESLEVVSDSYSGAVTTVTTEATSAYYKVVVSMPSHTFDVYSESDVLEMTNTTQLRGTWRRVGESSIVTFAGRLITTVSYNTVTGELTCSQTMGGSWVNINTSSKYVTYSSDIAGISTLSLLGHPTYVDCDLGEAYRIVEDEYIPLNRYIDLGSDLPKLGVGANEVTVDDTITELQIVPRWWRI